MFPISIISQYGNKIEKINIVGIRSLYTTTTVPSPRNIFGYTYDSTTNIAYVCGGYNNSAVYNDLWSFNLITREWKLLSNAPVSTYGSALCAYMGNIYLFGGITNNQGAVNNNFYVYNITTNTWSQNATSIGKPAQSTYSKLVSAGDGNLYLWGSPGTSNLYSYNISTNTWKALTASTIANNSTGDMCTDGSYLYCQGSAGQKYNISTGQWSTIPLYGSIAGRMVYNYYDSNIYCISNNVMNLGKYDSSTNTWSTLYVNSTITGSTGSLFPSNNKNEIFYVLGYEGSSRTNKQYVFN